jgi:hypothetical protein
VVDPRRRSGSGRSLVGRTVQLSNNVLSTMRGRTSPPIYDDGFGPVLQQVFVVGADRTT